MCTIADTLVVNWQLIKEYLKQSVMNAEQSMKF